MKIPRSPINNISAAPPVPVSIDTLNLEVLPPSCGIQYYKDGILFLAGTKNEDKMLPSHLSFGSSQAYYSELKGNTTGQPTVFSPSVPFQYPCDAITFGDNFNTMYFTGKSASTNREKIYRAELKNNDGRQEWVINQAPLDFCKGNSTYSHPALSADGKMMVFESNRTGSAGGMDLFVTRNEKGKWSTPVSLGKKINTGGNEVFPNLDADNNLFFSSDRLPGNGGYDIFMCKYNGKEWDNPVNLTRAINSGKDEIAFKLNPRDRMTAIFTSKDKEAGDKMQLYRVRLKDGPISRDFPNLSETLYAMATGDIGPDGLSARKLKADRDKKAEAELNRKLSAKNMADSIEAADKNALIIYRVQFLSSVRPKVINSISIRNKNYTPYEYIYKDLYRYAIGEFNDLKQAVDFRRACRKSGYPRAFVIAFRNNVRTNDPVLFRLNK